MLDFKGKKITVMGLGVHGGGVGVARFLAKAGANVIVTDLKTKEDLKESTDALKGLPIQFILGQHRNEDFSRADMIIQNPAVPSNAKPLQIARENKIPIETDIGIFFELCSASIIGVTGTRGKSTTSALVADILKLFKKNVILAGNIRISVLDELPKIKKEGLAVLELSSWQLEGLAVHRKSPHIAVMTNIMRDHMNRYKNMDEYIEAKKNILRFQNQDDYAVLNYDDNLLRGLAKEVSAKVFFYGLKMENIAEPNFFKGAWRKEDKVVWGDGAEEIIDLNKVQLKGEHNVYNILAAVSVAKILGVPAPVIQRGVYQFSGLEGRLQHIKMLHEVDYINDTTSTTPDATIAALRSFPDKKIILILGGNDKELEYAELASEIVSNHNVKSIVLLSGTATEKISIALRAAGYQSEIIQRDSMDEAVTQAHRVALNQELVLLSPAATSFGLFKNEFDRGKKFNNAVNGLD